MIMSTPGRKHSDLAYADMSWESAATPRGQIDAAECKYVVLDLLFLKHIRNFFEFRKDERKGEFEADGMVVSLRSQPLANTGRRLLSDSANANKTLLRQKS